MQVTSPSPTAVGGGPEDEKWALPKEFSTVQLKKSSDHVHKDEIEAAEEIKPDYTATKLKPTQVKEEKEAVEAIKKAAAEQRPSFVGVNLRKSIRHLDEEEKKREDFEKRHNLPDEYATVQLKKHNVRKEEIEILQEEKPDYSAVQLKASSHHRKSEIEPLQEEKPDYTAVQLKAAKPIERPKNENRASFVAPGLKSTGHGDALKSGGDVAKEKKEDTNKGALGGEFAAVSLKASTHQRKSEIEPIQGEKPDYTAVQLKASSHHRKSEIEPLQEEKPDYTAVQLKAAKPIERPKNENRASFVAPGLKSTGHGDALKSGGDVAKERKEDTNKGALGGEFAAVSLKASTHQRKSEIEPVKEEKPDYAAVQLKASTHQRKTEIEPLKEEKPDYTAVQLKAAKPIKKPKNENRASFVAPGLKSTGHGDALKSGGDVAKEKKEDPNKGALGGEFAAVSLKALTHRAEIEPLQEEKPDYTAVQLKAAKPIEKPKVESTRASFVAVGLKSTGHGDALKSGGDVAKEKKEDPNKGALGGEFAAVSLKASKHKPEIEAILEEKPDYTAVQLKAAKPIEKPKNENRASFVAVGLKSTGHGDALKSGGDVAKEKKEDLNKGALGGEFAAVSLKASTHKPEIEPLQEEKPDYSAVKLKASAPVEKKQVAPRRATFSVDQLKNTGLGDVVKSGGDVLKIVAEDPNKGALGGEFAAVSLKSSSHHRKSEIEPIQEEKPEYTAVQLKASSPIVKKQIAPRRATFSVDQLKNTGLGDVVKSGKDVEGKKIDKSFDLPEEFGTVQLKKPVERKNELIDC